MANEDVQYGVWPVVPRANDTDKAVWAEGELESLPVEFDPASNNKDDDKDSDAKSEPKSESEEEKEEPKAPATPAPATPAPTKPVAPKA